MDILAIDGLVKTQISFVVTGTPRSGTTYVARVLQKLGLDCRHERRFNPWEIIMEVCRFNEEPWGDSSWLAAPFLQALPADAKVFHVVRDPLSAVNSIIGTGQIDWPDDYRTFIAKYCWNDANYWPTDVGRDAQTFWVRWNLMIEQSGRVSRRFRVEETAAAVPGILSDVGLAGVSEQDIARVLQEVPRNMNARKHRSALRLTRDDLTPEFIQTARRYGYDY
jgi:hypothetical protein